jgi:hypothetical protein
MLGSNMYWRPDERWSFYLSLEIWDGLCEQFHCQKILKNPSLFVHQYMPKHNMRNFTSILHDGQEV